MNNLGAFSEVVNGIRQALFNLNTKIDTVRLEVNNLQTTVQTTVNNAPPTLQEATVRQWIAELEQSITLNLTLLEQQLKQQLDELKCKCTPPPEPLEQEKPFTLEDVQNLIDTSLAKLLEGLQPLSSFETTQQVSQESKQATSDELPPTEPVTEVTIEPVVATAKTIKKNVSKRTTKKT